MLRKFRTSLLTAIAFASVLNVFCQAQSQHPWTRHVREATVNGESRQLGRLAATQSMRLVLVLPLRDQPALEELLRELYDPASPSYRKFLTVEQFTARFGPTPEDYDAVIRFAEANGLTVVGKSRNRVNLDVVGSLGDIERAFHLSMGVYMHPTEGRTFFAPDREPTPDLSVRLWHISGLDNYSTPHPALAHKKTTIERNATTGSGPGAAFLGSDMRAAYYGGTLTGTGQTLGLVEFYGTDLADLTTYYKNAGQTNNVPVTLQSVGGASKSCYYPFCDDTEQTLDMTQALGMAPGLSSLVMYIGSANPLNDAGVFNAMATANPLNAQLSSSWAWTPADSAADDPYFMEFSAQGQNLFQAAGDSGAWTSSSTTYPADDVYVTSVGGTDLTTSSAGGPWSSETVWVDGGGGVSPNQFAIPSWQTSVDGCTGCSQNYRNAPDVSANANFTFYVCADQIGCTSNNYGGTSFAAPMWAGYLALLNEQAVANGKSPLGFINPSLYSIGMGSNYDADFHDITSGSNGDSATTGYDLASGWGSPNGSGLINDLAGTSSTPSFSLSASPSSVSVSQGNSGQSAITSTVTGGFGSSISLTASGQPAGVTVGFNPTSITGAGTSSMTMTVASSTAVGTYTITITGTSGSTLKTTTVALTVTAAPSFSISASPSSVSVNQGNSGQSTITSTVTGGFGSSISLTASGQPAGVTVGFNPTSITGAGTSTMTMTVASSTTIGTYTITVTGTSGSTVKTTTVSITVTSGVASNFSISASPTSISVHRGSSGTSTITTSISGGFNSAISLSASGQGSASNVTFSPSSIAAPGAGTSTMTVKVGRNAKTGSHTITITGTGGGTTHTTTVTLVVN